MKKNSIKNVRINNEVMRTLAEELRGGVKDPRIHPFTSVVSCEVATDLKTCRVYISVLGDENDLKNTMEGLKKASGYLRSCLARELNLRNTPELIFIPSDSIAYGVEMSKMINDVVQQDEERHVADEWDRIYEEGKETEEW